MEEAVNSANFDGDAKSVIGALSFETFFRSTEHAADAGDMSAVALPFVKEPADFDHLFSILIRQDDRSRAVEQSYIVAKKRGALYQGLDQQGTKGPNITPIGEGHFRDDLSSNEGVDKKEAGRLEWEIDTTTSNLLRFWKVEALIFPSAAFCCNRRS